MRRYLFPIILLIPSLHLVLIWKIHSTECSKKPNSKIKIQNVVISPKVDVEKPPKLQPKKLETPQNLTQDKKPNSKIDKPKKNQDKQFTQNKPSTPHPIKKNPPISKKIEKENPLNKSWQEKLAHILHEALDFPEFGKVKVNIEILGNGKIKSVQIIESENEKNEQYLLKTLMGITLPPWSLSPNDKQSLIITFASAVD